MVTQTLDSETSMKVWFVIALAVFAAQAPAPQGPPAIVEGMVLRYGSSDAIPGATVELRKAPPPVPAGVNFIQLAPGTQLPQGVQLPPGTQLAPQPVSLTASTNAEGRKPKLLRVEFVGNSSSIRPI